MEQSALWDQWSTAFAEFPPAPAIEGLTCPSDPPENAVEPWCNYVGNAGQAFSDGTREATASRPANAENVANGVFFDDNKNPHLTTSAVTDGRGDLNTAQNFKDYPRISMSLSYIQTNDGQSKTLFVSENLHTWYWTFDIDADASGRTVQNDGSNLLDTKHLFGFIWKNRPTASVDPQGLERINGDENYDKNPAPETMLEFSEIATSIPPIYESYGYPSSKHPGGVNAAFCDGHIVFISETIDPNIYSMLMTSNRNRSGFKDYTNNPMGIPDRKVNQPSDGDY
jgi:prepilin-type processing-associated H-X9-DG protein